MADSPWKGFDVALCSVCSLLNILFTGPESVQSHAGCMVATAACPAAAAQISLQSESLHLAAAVDFARRTAHSGEPPQVGDGGEPPATRDGGEPPACDHREPRREPRGLRGLPHTPHLPPAPPPPPPHRPAVSAACAERRHPRALRLRESRHSRAPRPSWPLPPHSRAKSEQRLQPPRARATVAPAEGASQRAVSTCTAGVPGGAAAAGVAH